MISSLYLNMIYGISYTRLAIECRAFECSRLLSSLLTVDPGFVAGTLVIENKTILIYKIYLCNFCKE